MAKRQIKKDSAVKKETFEKTDFLLNPIPLYAFLLSLIAVTFFCYFANSPKKASVYYSTAAIPNAGNDPCSNLIRQNDTGLIRPLLLVESGEEEVSLIPLKAKVSQYLEQKKKEGVITSASVYLNNLNTVNHIEINPDELYDPASIMKVPMLLLYLNKAEDNPGLLNRNLLFAKHISGLYSATIKSHTITEGKSYSIKDLLYYMIAYSDNEAFWLLGKNVENNDFIKLCADFDIPVKSDNIVHGDNEPSFVANVNSISRFFRVLYNATFLERKTSQYALSLLAQSDYKDGILKGVDPNVRVAHKFGERGEGGIAQMHEFGIVYLDNNPYLLGVMTKGSNKEQLAEVISSISKITFDGMDPK